MKKSLALFACALFAFSSIDAAQRVKTLAQKAAQRTGATYKKYVSDPVRTSRLAAWAGPFLSQVSQAIQERDFEKAKAIWTEYKVGEKAVKGTVAAIIFAVAAKMISDAQQQDRLRQIAQYRAAHPALAPVITIAQLEGVKKAQEFAELLVQGSFTQAQLAEIKDLVQRKFSGDDGRKLLQTVDTLMSYAPVEAPQPTGHPGLAALLEDDEEETVALTPEGPRPERRRRALRKGEFLEEETMTREQITARGKERRRLEKEELMRRAQDPKYAEDIGAGVGFGPDPKVLEFIEKQKRKGRWPE